MGLRSSFQRLIPTRDQLLASRFTRWMAPWLGQRKLWHLSRRGVAMGVAIGIFFGLLIPIAQIPVSAAAAIVLRANLPAAMGSTLITNPVTFGPIYYLAYRAGARVLGQPVRDAEAEVDRITQEAMADAQASGAAKPTAWQRIQALGKPLVVGLALFAVAGGLSAYAAVSLGWWLWVHYKRRYRPLGLRRRPSA